MKSRRIGKVVVSDVFMIDAGFGHGANLFAGAIPLHIERNFHTDNTYYLLWHPSFRELQRGEAAPYYEATFNSDSVTPIWKEIEEPK